MKDKIKQAKDKAVVDLIGEHVYAILELAEGESDNNKSFVLTFSRHEDCDDLNVFFYDNPDLTEHVNEILLDSCDETTEHTVVEVDDSAEEANAVTS